MTLMMIKSLAGKKKIVGIGEIGLDFHYDNSPRDVQREVFRKQIRMANDLKMPIVIHSRDADEETMEILKEEGAFDSERKSWFSERPAPQGWESAAKDARVLLHRLSRGFETFRELALKNDEGLSKDKKLRFSRWQVLS